MRKSEILDVRHPFRLNETISYLAIKFLKKANFQLAHHHYMTPNSLIDICTTLLAQDCFHHVKTKPSRVTQTQPQNRLPSTPGGRRQKCQYFRKLDDEQY